MNWKLFNWIGLAGWLGIAVGAETPPADPVRYQFRMPHRVVYRVAPQPAVTLLSVPGPEWVPAWPEAGGVLPVALGRRVVLQLPPGTAVGPLLESRPLQLQRTVADGLWILEAPDVWTALREAQRLAQQPEVLACYPVTRRPGRLNGAYSPTPNDPYFNQQWYLENRTPEGKSAGVDLNVRAAWPFTQGGGVLMAIADDGVELTHPEFTNRAAGAPHHNFFNGTTNGGPSSDNSSHATAVAGLAVATGNNHRGIVGVAPAATMASWVIFSANDNMPSDAEMMDMFQFASNRVAVQNHSWGNAEASQLPVDLLESVGISNAVAYGRGGLGVVMVHAAGNQRQVQGNANDDAYASDPRGIAVAAVRQDGRVASYSNPGACVLVAAPSGDADEGFPTLFTTDRQGAKGYNRITSTNDLADYAYGANGFSGTSASTPQITGVAALLLAANPRLTARDVQHLLILSSRHFDLTDPDLTTNSAGLLVSHSVGFGVPDAGAAVALARTWSNRPPLLRVTLSQTNTLAIPDDGLRLLVDTTNGVESIRTLPSQGPHPDQPTGKFPLVFVGMATNPITDNLAGRAALIQRGSNYFQEKIEFAAAAGAAFAVIFNNLGSNDLVYMDNTEFVPIPAVFIGKTDGDRLVQQVRTNPLVNAQLHLDSVGYTFFVTNTLQCEHVGIRVTTDHPQRGDLRLTLLSPNGTRSILQQINGDINPGPDGWTYWTVHHFYESSAGIWSLNIADESRDLTGSLLSATLIIEGISLHDDDWDGLDDDWEMAHFNTLAYGPRDDNDSDGANNMREFLEGTDPVAGGPALVLDLSRFNSGESRLSWPGDALHTYDVWAGPNPATPLTWLTNLPGTFPVTEWFLANTNAAEQFFQVRRLPRP